MRRTDLLDHLLGKIGALLAATGGRGDPAQYPAGPAGAEDAALGPAERQTAAACMRVNHAGEVAAQGLYLGQALTAREEDVRAHMRAAAAEEAVHLYWCRRRLDELDAPISALTPVWYAGSIAIGALAGATGDQRSLGFVVETERQVEAHLTTHLERLPVADVRSRSIVAQMRADEARHRENAADAGALPVPAAVCTLMAVTAKIMTTTARVV